MRYIATATVPPLPPPQVFAERYRMKFIQEEEVRAAPSITDDSEMEEDEDDQEEEDEDFQNAVEELDESSELYKTIVAAIIKEGEEVFENKKKPNENEAESETDFLQDAEVVESFSGNR